MVKKKQKKQNKHQKIYLVIKAIQKTCLYLQYHLKKNSLIDLLVEARLASSKSEARRLIEQNGISINQIKENNVDKIIEESDFKEGFLIIQKGKKVFLKIKIEA